MLAAVVFDLDGVLLDSESVWDAARRALVADSGGRWRPGATNDMLGMSAPEWSRYLHEQLGVPLEGEEISERVVAGVLERYRSELPLLPGAAEAVSRLAARWPLALATSANRSVIDAVLAQAGLAGEFTATVSAEEVARGKPAPDVYLAAARALRVDPADAAAVEDSTNGLRAAAAAGMTVVAIPNRHFAPAAEALELADLVLDSPNELTPQALLDVRRSGPPAPESA
jgi:HAD superfamily hydrolase (TIGR01509 family)